MSLSFKAEVPVFDANVQTVLHVVLFCIVSIAGVTPEQLDLPSKAALFITGDGLA